MASASQRAGREPRRGPVLYDAAYELRVLARGAELERLPEEEQPHAALIRLVLGGELRRR